MTVLRPLTPLDHRRRSCPAQLPPTQYRAVPACTQGGGRFNGSLAVKTPPKSSRQPRTRHSDLFFLFPTTLESLSLSINTSTWETCLAGKTNLPVNVRAESQKIAVWIYTALPCTTPRPAPKSSTDDLAWDLWARPPPKRRPYFGWVSRGGVSRSLTDHSSPTPRRPRLKNKQHRPGIRPTDERPEPSTARRTLFSNRDGSRYGHPDNKKPHASVSLPSSSIDSTFRGLQV